MAYIKQIGADVYVAEGAQDALAYHPELFESVEGDIPVGFAALNYARDVPESITARQFLIAATNQGVITTAEAISRSIPADVLAALAGLPQAEQDAIAITWATMTTVVRADPLTSMIGQVLGMDDAALDSFFIAAAGI